MATELIQLRRRDAMARRHHARVRRQHAMPFGAQLTAEGTVRFRLWAPEARSVHLLLSEQAPIPMLAVGHGWFERVSDQAQAGSRYRFQIDDALCVPDPASRCNPQSVHADSMVVDAAAFAWQDSDWRGRPWHETVIYELHVGTFTPQGTFAALEQKLDYLVDLGITAIELMPLAQFPGHRNWGYDGTLIFAPHPDYGRPEELKRLIQSAHQRHLMVFLDVVYNHFGPEGNYLHHYAPQFFTERHHTPWGVAINFDGESSRTVRDFYLHNALYWLEEYHFDGLRLDAVHAMIDDSDPDFLQELAETIRATFGKSSLGKNRQIHLLLENDHNAAHYLERDDEGRSQHYDAQWNDDFHHACHVLLTGEQEGYYADYSTYPIAHLGRCLCEGFAYQGEHSTYRQGIKRGELSSYLPTTAFVAFLQNHDQIGNRALGERLSTLIAPPALAAAVSLLLLTPQIPLLFMGEEWGARQPFPFFCQFDAGLAEAVTAGRRKEFAHFERFRDPADQATIPDPGAEPTFNSAHLDWQVVPTEPHSASLALYRQLLTLRRRVLVPRLEGARGLGFRALAERALSATWRLGDDSLLTVLVNLGTVTVALPEVPDGTLFYRSSATLEAHLAARHLPAYSVAWFLEVNSDSGKNGTQL